MKMNELLEDGRIVKGVNTTVDVDTDEIKTQAAKFGNTVDKDGRPPTLSSRVKGKSTNVLFNLGITESVDQKTRNNFNEFANFCVEVLGIKKFPKIIMTGKDLDETFGYFDMEDQSITVSYSRRHQMDTMRTLAHELVHCKQREEKEELDGSDGSPDENEANAMAGVLLRRWAGKNPHLFAETKYTDMELALMEGGHEVPERFTKVPGDLFNALEETWSEKYKRSINCSNPKGFSQKAHCAGRKKNEDIELDEGIIDSIVDFLKPYIERAQEKIKKLRGAVKQEYMETDLMWEILQKGDKARPFEIEFANNQFKDVLKGVGLGAWLALPIPGNTLWITLLEKLLNKFDISIMPDEVKRQVFNSMYENFADGKKKGKSRPGRVKRAGASCKGSVTSLRKRAKNASGEKAKMYHWCANMKSGRKKK